MLQEVVGRGSFSAAAESLHLSQSAVSQQIAVLEREVGIPLLERTSDGPKLTAAGEALMSHGDAVMCRLEEAERELSRVTAQTRRTGFCPLTARSSMPGCPPASSGRMDTPRPPATNPLSTS